MAVNTYSTQDLIGIIQTIRQPQTFFLSLCFPRVQTFDTETIDFDVVDRGRRLAPFVAPTAAGKVMKDKGHTTKRFAPAYVKPKSVVEPGRVIKRMAGEAYGGSLSPQARRDAIVADILAEHRNQHTNRQEWMAAQAIINGSVTVSGDDYPTQVVSFGRRAGNTKTLTSTAKWDDAGMTLDKMLDNLEDWGLEMQESSNVNPTDVVFAPNAWKLFRNKLKGSAQMLDYSRGTTMTLNVDPNITGQEVSYKGSLGGLNFWVFAGTYEDDTGTLQKHLGNSDMLLLNPAMVEGVRAFGAILDAEAGYTPGELFAKNWINPDPSVEYLLTQSAPLMIPTRPNAVMKITVA